MTQHVLDLLPGYHDNELNPRARQHVEKHLHDCPECRAELEALAVLSTMLQVDRMPEMTAPDRFAAQVGLKLPRGIPAAPAKPAGKLPGWLLAVPLVLIAAWAFLQAALLVSSMILNADWFMGGAGDLFAWIRLPGDLIGNTMGLLILELVLLTATSLLLGTWMAFWWSWNSNHKTLTNVD